MPSTSQRIQDDNLKPYAHQLRDAQMELEMQISRKPKRKRGPETDSPAVKAALQTLRDDQTGIKRDLADDISTSSDTQRSPSRISGRLMEQPMSGSHTHQKPRSRSQLQASRDEVPPYIRTSVTLTIDATGRAKTETKVLADEGKSFGSQKQVDSDEENDSTSSSSTDVMVLSQTQSFANPSEQRQPKLGRFTHHAQTHSQKSSYGSTLLSTGNIHMTSNTARRRPSSNLTIQSNIQNRYPRMSSNDHGRDYVESEAETIIDSEDDRGDAQSALKKVLQSRRKSSGKPSMRGKSNNLYDEQQASRPPQNAPLHSYYHESLTPTRNGYNQSYNNISPTTITDPDLATPGSSRSTISGDSVRCLCHGGDDDGQLMIQW